MKMQDRMPDLYRLMKRIRRFEETVLEKFPEGVFFGTTHTYLGQEANAAGVLTRLRSEDIVYSNHRCHGHFLAHGGDPFRLFAELMGKASGVCGGRGGSQHLCQGNFYSNGVQGGIVPVATGMALAEKQKGSGAVTITFLGDGTLGEGVVYESLNLASLWRAPILYVLENNRIAQTTPIELSIAGSLPGRFLAFGIQTEELETSDVLEILPCAARLIDEVRSTQSPRALILNTCRFGPHSKGDDTRDPDFIEKMKTRRDPIQIHRARIDPSFARRIDTEVSQEIQDAFQRALAEPFGDEL
jgi:TPP-dependent pyruvate/acetoin dehydrogenase alpha subunit